ncbi:S66 family peptidase [Jeotgalibacillus marinus]|uniref:S66 peptidase family protein n=1 Tax=Jeotgalibacillus marinus TaxID=86667 RepID=A0ABV3Q4W6_9BACL
MIYYPTLRSGGTIGVTAPSSGVPTSLHEIVKQSVSKMEERGFTVVCGETVWTQHKAKSSSAKKRGHEFNEMMKDQSIDFIIPPWGGELSIEMLEYVDFKKMNKKWILGYSDTSVLLLAITLKTGLAAAHGTNLVDLRGDFWDETTAKWIEVLSTRNGESISQYSSEKYQQKWDFENSSPCVFHLTEQTKWKTISGQPEQMEGRLLGGCIDVIRHLVGTPYGDVKQFREQYTTGEPIIWFLENGELSTTDLRRSLVQMKLAGWFDNCAGILFGRSEANTPVDNYLVEDVYQDLFEELGIPIVYDIDCGHQPPQIMFINGAVAEVEVVEGTGKVVQWFK